MAWAPDLTLDETQVAAARRRLVSCSAATPLQVLRGLDSTRRGLDETGAQLRLARLGENAITPGGRTTWAGRMAAAVRNPFVVILICLTAVSAATGDTAGAAVISAMAVISCVLRVAREGRSDRAAAALRAMVATTATVVRRASPGSPAIARELPVDQLVPGDVVELAAGDMVPADLRLLRTHDLLVSQAVFTGESSPAAKRAASVITGGAGLDAPACPPGSADDHAPVFDAPGLCFMGTSVVSGSATAVVVATGMSTYLGSTQQDLPRATAETAFDRGVRDVSGMLILLMLVCVPAVLAVNASIRGHLLEALMFAVAVAVGLTPEMLPVVVTGALASSAAVVARKAAIVKRLPAMHNLGAMGVLCTDKTGTLTEDRVSLGCHLDLAGRTDPGVLRWAWLNSYFSASAADGAVTDVLDQALLACGEDRGLFAEDSIAIVDVIPFDPRRRRVTVVTRTVGVPGQHTLITKGAPAEVLGCCSRFRSGGRDLELGPDQRERVAATADGAGAAGDARARAGGPRASAHPGRYGAGPALAAADLLSAAQRRASRLRSCRRRRQVLVRRAESPLVVTCPYQCGGFARRRPRGLYSLTCAVAQT